MGLATLTPAGFAGGNLRPNAADTPQTGENGGEDPDSGSSPEAVLGGTRAHRACERALQVSARRG